MKSAFEKWEAENGAKNYYSTASCRVAWLSALRWALRQTESYNDGIERVRAIDPDKIRAEIEKVEEQI